MSYNVYLGTSKTSKLAGNGEIRIGLLVPLQQEREDSGIDSEDAACMPGVRFPGGHNVMDSSSSDDEFIMDPARDERDGRNNAKDMQDAWMDFVGMDYPMVPLVRRELDDSRPTDRNSPDRSSPPLYEVELTASDEDDDTSNVEVVIPLNPLHCRKVMTSKTELVIEILCDLFCCFPK